MLLESLGSAEPQVPVWYPVPERTGPGHARIARFTVGILGRDQDPKDPSYIRDILARADRAGIETIVLSSENFSRAYPSQLGLLRDALEPYSIHLVVTLTAIVRRVLSNWQQMVRNGLTAPLSESADLVFARESLAPDLVRRFCDALRPACATLIIVDSDAAPSALIRDFLHATDLWRQLPKPLAQADAQRKANVSFGDIETRILRHLNLALAEIRESHPELDQVPIRQLFIRTLHSPEWCGLCPRVPVSLPDSMIDRVRALERRTRDELKGLIESGELRVCGDPNKIFSLIEAGIRAA
jgi:hypothetical protein